MYFAPFTSFKLQISEEKQKKKPSGMSVSLTLAPVVVGCCSVTERWSSQRREALIKAPNKMRDQMLQRRDSTEKMTEEEDAPDEDGRVEAADDHRATQK